jgi:tetratricopeptide (TPR) repeat protein
MRLTLFIGVLCLVILQPGCKRGNHNNTSNASGSAVGGDGLAAARSQARQYVDKGRELYRSDQDSEAVAAFQQAIKLDPDLAEAHFRLALSYEALDKEAEAETEYKKAVETYKKHLDESPKDAEAHYNLAQTYANLHEYSEAVREYRQATKLKSDDADIYYDLGNALTKLAKYDEAATAFSKSLEIDPEDFRAQEALEEAKEGANRIRAGKKHMEDLLKKQKEDELKKAGGEVPSVPETKPTPPKKGI